MQLDIFRKSLVALSVVTLTAVAGVASTQALSSSSHHDDKGGYSKDQCKDGGWKNFKNPDGSMMFKNQGQCIKFFSHQNRHDGKNNGEDNSAHVNNDVKVNANTGNISVHQGSGSATITTGDSSPTIDITNDVSSGE